MSDTPRTDAVLFDRLNLDAHARQLERELSAALARAEAAEIVAKARMTMIGELVEENKKVTAELDRLTTLRPASEHDGKTEVIWWDINQGWKPVRSAPVPWTIDDRTRVTHWTPIPTPKEPT